MFPMSQEKEEVIRWRGTEMVPGCGTSISIKGMKNVPRDKGKRVRGRPWA